NLFTKQVATMAGISFTGAFFVMFVVSERIALRRRAAGSRLDQFQLETEKENILTRAKEEAALEKARLAEQTEADVQRLKAQAEADLARLAHQQRNELRRFSAEESVRRAEEKLRAAIDGKADARLVKASIAEIGGLN
ncbi:MAG: hypothetical protein ACJ73D_09680, partial [Pyrinomonadaceae bacterium]